MVLTTVMVLNIVKENFIGLLLSLANKLLCGKNANKCDKLPGGQMDVLCGFWAAFNSIRSFGDLVSSFFSFEDEDITELFDRLEQQNFCKGII